MSSIKSQYDNKRNGVLQTSQARTIHNKERLCLYCVELGRAINDAYRTEEFYNVDELEQWAQHKGAKA